MTDPKDIVEAYLHVATVNHYLVVVSPVYTSVELNEAEQLLIAMDNAADNANPTVVLALDLLQHDRKGILLMIDHNIVEVCRAYAELVCDARRLFSSSPDYAACLRAATRALYACAPVAAMPHLDTVKRVLEIDTQITTVSMVLLRASLISEDRQRWAMRGDAPSDPDAGGDLIPLKEKPFICRHCGRISWHPQDMETGYCGACHDFTAREDAP